MSFRDISITFIGIFMPFNVISITYLVKSLTLIVI